MILSVGGQRSAQSPPGRAKVFPAIKLVWFCVLCLGMRTWGYGKQGKKVKKDDKGRLGYRLLVEQSVQGA